MEKVKLSLLSVCLSLAFAQYLNAQTPREEYPRPQFERAEWVLSLIHI